MPMSATINATASTNLGDAGVGSVCVKVISLLSSSFSGSIVVKGRMTGTSDTPLAIPYRRRYLNGAVSDDAFGSAAITGTSVIEVNSAGIDVSLDTTYTSGSMAVRWLDLVG